VGPALLLPSATPAPHPESSAPPTLTDFRLSFAPSCKINGAAIFTHTSAFRQLAAPSAQHERNIALSITPGFSALPGRARGRQRLRGRSNPSRRCARLPLVLSYSFSIALLPTALLPWSAMSPITESAYVTSKGQVVVPARLRRKFGIKPGTRLNFTEEKGRIVVQPFTKEFIDSFCGIFKLKPGEKSAVQELLEDRDRERAREDRELAEDKRK
jgi:AbrB family looped-hinge helix DNA binding protein